MQRSFLGNRSNVWQDWPDAVRPRMQKLSDTIWSKQHNLKWKKVQYQFKEAVLDSHKNLTNIFKIIFFHIFTWKTGHISKKDFKVSENYCLLVLTDLISNFVPLFQNETWKSKNIMRYYYYFAKFMNIRFLATFQHKDDLEI